MSEISVTVKLFGAFRQYGDTVNFNAPAGCSVRIVREKIAALLKLPSADLVNDSALALDDEIVQENTVFTRDCALAILPPVCGG